VQAGQANDAANRGVPADFVHGGARLEHLVAEALRQCPKPLQAGKLVASVTACGYRQCVVIGLRLALELCLALLRQIPPAHLDEKVTEGLAAQVLGILQQNGVAHFLDVPVESSVAALAVAILNVHRVEATDGTCVLRWESGGCGA